MKIRILFYKNPSSAKYRWERRTEASQRLVAALMSAALLTTSVGAAVIPAEMVELTNATSITDMSRMLETGVTIKEELPAMQSAATGESAEVLEIVKKDEKYTSIIVKTETYKRIVLHFKDDIFLMDTQTGNPVLDSEISVDDQVFVYYDNAVMESEPPQAGVQAILTNLDKKHVPAHLLTVEDIERKPDGSLRILADNGGVYVTLPSDMNIQPFGTKNIVSLNDIRLGTRFFAWYDMVAMSMPGQATAYRVVLPLQKDCTFPVSAGDNEEFSAEGRLLDGIAFVPVRTVGEALGYTVSWNQEKKSVSLTKDTVQSNMFVNSDDCIKTKGDTAVMEKLESAMFNENGKCWVPAASFSALGESVQFSNGVLSIGGDSAHGLES